MSLSGSLILDIIDRTSKYRALVINPFYFIQQLFVIEGDYIYLKEGAHAKVSATTAVAKAAAAAAAASPVGSDRLPTVAVTPVAQVSQVQRGRNAKTSSKDDKARAQVPQDDLSTHKQRSLSPQHTKPGSTRQYASSLSSRNSVGNGIATPNSGGNLDDDNNTTGGEFGSNNLSGNNSGVIENGNANSYGNSRAGGYKGSRQQSRFVLPNILYSHSRSLV